MNVLRSRFAFIAQHSALLCAASLAAHAAPWQPAPVPGGLKTPWTDKVGPDAALADYPRPQLVRQEWQTLNGLWQYSVARREAAAAETAPTNAPAGIILVPFPVESALSGVQRAVTPDEVIVYRRVFTCPPRWKGRRVLLHFEGVDWEATAWLNGRELGAHRGGYDPFTFDLTDALKPDAAQELVVRVWDPTDQGPQPRGKQVLQPRDIWYTAVSGIWRSVWLEPVPATRIARLNLVPDVDAGRLRLSVAVDGAATGTVVNARATYVDTTVAVTNGAAPARELSLAIPNARLWSPDSPFLYGLVVELEQQGRVVDRVESYFGMRKIAVARDSAGLNRLFLNNKPLFMLGPLDQGWWPDGLYTAPRDDALAYDVAMTRKLGFNMCRKHVKVEPDRWYYHCDRMGLLVWQDMPSGDRMIPPDQPDITRTPESAEQFRREYRAMLDFLHNHPCVIVWVPFNEGWGQFDTAGIVSWTKQYDPTRLVDGPSGWADRGAGDLLDMHRYPGPAMFPAGPDRASVLGEFGAAECVVPGRVWSARGHMDRVSHDPAELLGRYRALIEALRPLAAQGLAGAVYTQTTDLEREFNGFLTYDRQVMKLDAKDIAPLHQSLIKGSDER